MSVTQERPDTQKILSGLKDFQRRTVDYVYRRLYEDEDRVRRFLIADEVGLGKTLVAKGVVARAVDRLWRRKSHRIDIVYICSNGDIARQNINRLNLLKEDPPRVARLTLLPKTIRSLKDRRLNFVSFTPGTSFNVNSRSGVYEERALIYWILREGGVFGSEAGPKNLLQCGMTKDHWRRRLGDAGARIIDEDLSQSYLDVLKANRKVRQHLKDLCERFQYARKHVPKQDREDQLAMVGTLRRLLAESCAKSLEPDLVILDEFQRFKDLLDQDDDGARLARALFNFPGARTLLLSATPYKMYTMYHESTFEDHYTDFIRTVKFLFDSGPDTERFETQLSDYRRGLLQLGSDGTASLEESKAGIERDLRRVMVRTERVPLTASGDGMVEQVTDLESPTPDELGSFALVDSVSRELGLQDAVEYWKSAPYLLNIMDNSAYKMKRELIGVLKNGGGGGGSKADSVHDKIGAAMHHWAGPGLLSYEAIEHYRKVESASAKLRSLMSQTVGRGVWQLLWVPPCLPYYSVNSGPYADGRTSDFSKALVFSSWQVVPKAISMLCSYEAERRMIVSDGAVATYGDEWRRRRALLRFPLDRERRPGGMSALTLLYPCLSLATMVDPLQESSRLAGGDGRLPDSEEISDAVSRKIRDLLAPVLARYGDAEEQVDLSWYWAAPALLDRWYQAAATVPWVEGADPTMSWAAIFPARGPTREAGSTEDEADDTNFAEHVRLFCEYLSGRGALGRPPEDLVDVLTRITLASPAIIALRSLIRVVGNRPSLADPTRLLPLLHSAGTIAAGFRSMFNLPETMALLRGSQPASSDDAYWQTVLEYCLLGNVQSVMDEYCHVLLESLGLVGKDAAKAVTELGSEIAEALSLRTVPSTFDEFHTNPAGGPIKITENRRIRCRFALRFGDGEEPDPGEIQTRADQVRRAFNSPFRPFILASTSIGQEGLDFHQYCHDVYHWNLPSNPVDLEQREGRVHRYKGHVIRRNVAKAYAGQVLGQGGIPALADPWKMLFDVARDSRSPGANDLVPYWICEVEGGHRVRRHIPAMPLSRELGQMNALRKTLVAYRMVFGQPRQEDLVGYLCDRTGELIDEDVLARAKIDLGPR